MHPTFVQSRSRVAATTLAALLLATAARPVEPVPPAAARPAPGRPPITLESLLAEMTDRGAVARFPDPEYRTLQASSYNRASVRRDQPGWFADSDGLGYLREVTLAGRHEWLVLEHDGPGCLTKFWTPYFYYDLGNHTGPSVRIYLDGSDTPILDESLIQLVLGNGSVRPPFAAPTARAGDVYLPIPFARSCRVTLSDKPFYYLINYRAYPAGTAVTSLTRADLDSATPALVRTAATLQSTAIPDVHRVDHGTTTIAPRRRVTFDLPKGPSALAEFTLQLPTAANNPAALRSTVLVMSFDGETTVWCPVGDFFSNADSLHAYATWQRSATSDGTFTCRWIMPYRRSARIRLLNLDREKALPVQCKLTHTRWSWDQRSMHFHAHWRPDDVAPGTPFQDWNFVDVRGRGVYVGDAWTVLNPQKNTWWGEGDEKIYVDDAWERGFPTHFGTGTEDYYGWAGGVLPTRADEFNHPFLANIRVGGLDGHTLGFNISTRTRSLDAIPFGRRFRFDMESSFGTDIRNPWNLLGYSAVTFWYAFPGATCNRPADPAAAARPILSLDELNRRSAALRAAREKPVR